MIIGIGGVSTAGKTTLARELREHYSDKKVITLCQDDFIKAIENIPLIRERIDWEHPDSIDHNRFLQAIQNEALVNEIVIAEGLMIFWNQPLFTLLDKKIFVELTHTKFMERKSLDNRWGHEPDWYIEHIWNSYLKYGQPPAVDNTFRVNGNFKPSLNHIIEYLEAQ